MEPILKDGLSLSHSLTTQAFGDLHSWALEAMKVSLVELASAMPQILPPTASCTCTAITCSSHGRRMANSSGPPCCPTPPYPGCPTQQHPDCSTPGQTVRMAALLLHTVSGVCVSATRATTGLGASVTRKDPDLNQIKAEAPTGLAEHHKIVGG